MSVTADGKSTRIISLLATTGTEIVAHTRCRRIRVQENYTSGGGGTTDLAMQAPVGADDVIILKGNPAVFTAPGPNGAFDPGTIVGKVTVLDVAGPVEGQQIEDQLI